jgi:glycosyltransferase involved in cell wall biosynthesis
MKILFIHSQYLQFGGEDTVVEQEVKLLNNKHRVETLFFKNTGGLNGFFQFLFSIWNIKNARIVKKKIKEFKPDVVHIHNLHFATGPLIIRTIKKLEVPLVLTIHNYRLLCPSATLMHNNTLYLKSVKKNFPWQAIYLGVYKNSSLLTFWLAFVVWFHKKIKTWQMIDKYVCLTQSTVDLFKDSKFGVENKRFFVKPNFTLLANSKSDVKRENHFLFVGRLSKEKGISIMLNAFKGTTNRLKVAGDGPFRSEVEQACVENKNIEYLGVLNKENVSLELQKTKALVFPSTWLETFGLTIIEAFSNHCLVIASNIGAPSTIVDDKKNGFHFKAGDVNDLKHKIEIANLLTPEKEKQMRDNAYNTYLNLYSSEKQYAYFNEIYNVKKEK